MPDFKTSNLDGWAHAPFLEKVTGIAPNIIYIFNQLTQSNEYVNRSIGSSLGYSTKEIQDMGDALFPTLCHPDDLSRIGPHMEAICQLSDGEVAQLEYRMKHRQGGWVWLLGFDTVFDRDEAGNVIRHLGIATDITEQKAAQENALAERRAADVANEELRAFAYSMSHDMKSPSNTLQLLLNEIKEQHGESLDDDAKQLLDMSLTTVGRMQVLVEDVLGYTQVVGQEVEFADVDLNALLEAIVLDLHAEIKSSNAKILIEKLPRVKGSESQLRLLFQNLIGNALKYRSQDIQPVVSVSSTSSDTDQTTFVHVKDNGIGIEKKFQQNIFEMFKRLHTSSEYPGTGLGLAICKRIALSHGGELAVESTYGAGSTFTIRLKRCD